MREQDVNGAVVTSAVTTARSERLLLALVIAVALHVAVILGISFRVELPHPPAPALTVTLTRHADPKPPAREDFIAATNQLGSGDADKPVETTSRHTTEFTSQTPAELTALPAPAPVTNAPPPDAISANDSSTRRIAPTEPAPTIAAPPSEERPRLSLDALSRDIAGLEARIAEEREARAERNRVKRLTSVSARSAVEAGYLQAWRQRVERIGNANYPGGGLDGSLRLLVIIRFDGRLEDVQLLESSGHPALDEAALRIVRLAAPFPAFPVDMRKHYDILEIIRTWQFSRGGARLDG